MKSYLSVMVNSFFICLLCLQFSDQQSDVAFPNQQCSVENFECQRHPWIEPFPSCVNHKCVCTAENRSCIHYTSSFYSGIQYFCGKCGDLGSECRWPTATTEAKECSYPGECLWDNFCHCNVGYLVGDICVYPQPVTATNTNITLIVVLLVLIISNRLVASWRYIVQSVRFCFTRRRCCNILTFRRQQKHEGRNPASGTKSAAFTISSSEFLTTSNDNDLEWAIELSLQNPENLNYLENENRNTEIENGNFVRNGNWDTMDEIEPRPSTSHENDEIRYKINLCKTSETGKRHEDKFYKTCCEEEDFEKENIAKAEKHLKKSDKPHSSAITLKEFSDNHIENSNLSPSKFDVLESVYNKTSKSKHKKSTKNCSVYSENPTENLCESNLNQLELHSQSSSKQTNRSFKKSWSLPIRRQVRLKPSYGENADNYRSKTRLVGENDLVILEDCVNKAFESDEDKIFKQHRN